MKSNTVFYLGIILGVFALLLMFTCAIFVPGITLSIILLFQSHKMDLDEKANARKEELHQAIAGRRRELEKEHSLKFNNLSDQLLKSEL